MLAHLLLGLAQAVGIVLIPFSPAGLWLQLGSLILFGWWSGFQPVGTIPLLILFALGITSVMAEEPAGPGGRADGARRRMGLAGLAGGGAGAAVGIPFPLLGSMFGAFLGAAIATLVAAFTARSERIGCAALGGIAVAMTLRTAAGIVIAVFTILTLNS